MSAKPIEAFGAQEMADYLDSLGTQTRERGGFLAKLDVIILRWSRVYRQLATLHPAFNAARLDLESGRRAGASQQLLGMCKKLATAFRELGDVPSPLCQMQTEWDGPCGRAPVGGECPNAHNHA